MREEGEQLSLFPLHSGRRTFQRGFPKFRGGNPVGDISAAEEPSAESGEEGSVARFQKRSLEDGRGFDIYHRRVGLETWHPHHPRSFGGVRARTLPKLRSKGIRDNTYQHVE